MPGRLLSSLVRPTSPPGRLTSSATSSLTDGQRSKRNSLQGLESLEAAERRLSAAMEHIIHPHKEKRKSIIRSSRSKDRSSKHDSRRAPATLDMIVESPPLVFYDTPANSSGALFSGLFQITVPETPGFVVLNEFSATLTKRLFTKKPVSNSCPDCTVKTEELKRWDLLVEPMLLKKGWHDFPISYLFPGHLPASADTVLGGVEYVLVGRAVTSTGEEIVSETILPIRRALLPGHDRTTLRIFPPTNLTARLEMPSVVHPIGSFPVQMTLSGVVEKGPHTQNRWRLRKMMWRIEEHIQMNSVPCLKHAHKIGGEDKAVRHTEVRVIGHSEKSNGWKTDFDTPGGEITMEFEAGIKPGSKPTCDLEVEGDIQVKHMLIVELVVAEEYCPNRNPKSITPTGAARVLRMHFNLPVTERSGLGISWDEEMPPMYEDVPDSPPSYWAIDGIADSRPPSLQLDDRNSSRPESVAEGQGMTEMTRQMTRLTVEDLTMEPVLTRP
ncbi:hypothetical protein VTN49DRAFT_3165 [Thermomyces lanuginosus]|uniref:uncharacterized protein n=1 Tax=Thermomyces lanuginosus TaxID=5541 RepID=UPI00374381AD